MSPLMCLALASLASLSSHQVQERAESFPLHRAADASLQEGDLEAARSGFLQCLGISPENATIAYALACVEARSGIEDAALEWLSKAAEWGYADAAVAEWDDDLAAISDETHFRSILQSMRDAAPDGNQDKPVVQIIPPKASPRPTACAMSPAGRTVLVGYEDGSLATLDPTSLEVRQRAWRFMDEVWKVTWSRDGSRYAAVTHGGMVGIWSEGEDRPILFAPAFKPPVSIRDSYHERFGDEKTVSAETLTFWVEGLEARLPFGCFLQFDPMGDRLLVAGEDRGGSLWSGSGTLLHRWEEPLGGFFDVPLAWSSDGETIALASETLVRFFDGKTGETKQPPMDTEDPVNCVAFDPRRDQIATGHEDGYVRIWNRGTGELIDNLQGSHPTDEFFALDEEREVYCLSYAPDGERLACTTGTGVYAIVWDANSHEQLWISKFGGGRMGEEVELVWSPDGRRLWWAFASGGMDLSTVVPGIEHEERIVASGFVPTLGMHAPDSKPLGATIVDPNGIALLDGGDSHVRLIRVDLEQGDVLFQAPTGHFMTTAESLAGWNYAPHPWEDRLDLAPEVERLFDPKRVRASQAGVRLVPAN